MAEYCTLLEVKQVAKEMTQEFDRNDPKVDDELIIAIEDASRIADTLFDKRYNLSDISSSIPFANQFTKNKAALIILMRWFPDKPVLEKLKSTVSFLKKAIVNGNVLDATGSRLTQNFVAEISNTANTGDDMEDLFNGS